MTGAPLRKGWILVLLLGHVLGNGSGCFVPPVDTTLFESPKGRIVLETFSDASFRASHPQNLDAQLLTRILAGVRVREQKPAIEVVLTGTPEASPAFGESEIAFLAPRLASALAQASSEERVVFHVTLESGKDAARTEGMVYVSGNALYLSITRYRIPAGEPHLLSRPSPSFTRPPEWDLLFEPDSALRNPDPEAVEAADGAATLGVLAIDLQEVRQFQRSTKETLTGEPAPPTSEGERAGEEGESSDEHRRRTLQELRRSIEEQERTLERLEQEIEGENK